MKLNTSYKNTSNPIVPGGARQYVVMDNYKRNARWRVRLSADVDITVGPAGATKNGGSLFGCIQGFSVNENGTDTYGPATPWSLKQLAESDAGQPLDFARLPENAPIGTYSLFEQFDVIFSRTQQARGSETAFLEADPTSVLRFAAWAANNAGLNLAAPGAATITLGPITMEVTQVDAFAAGRPLPLYKRSFWEIEQPFAGAVSNLEIQLKVTDLLSDIIVYAMGDDAAGGTQLVGDAINSLRVIGSGRGQDLIGPAQFPFAQAVAAQRDNSGGDVGFLDAIYQHKFTGAGMLSDAEDPRTISNLRMQLNVQPSVIAPNANRIIVGLATLTVPSPVTAWQQVQYENRPAWAVA